MINEELTKGINKELVANTLKKIDEDVYKANVMFPPGLISDSENWYVEASTKILYVNQLDMEFQDYWYSYLARNMILRSTKPTDEEIAHLHDYANAVMAIQW